MVSPVGSIAIMGASGHGRTVLANLIAGGCASDVVFLDDGLEYGSVVDGCRIIGGRKLLSNMEFLHINSIIIGLGDTKLRGELSRLVIDNGGVLLTTVHPSAVICQDVSVGIGTAIMPNAVLGAGVRVGDYCIVNNCASIGHMSRLKNGCSVNDGSRIGGAVVIGVEAFLGVGVNVVGPCHIGDRAIVGAGATLLKDVPPDVTVAGTPAMVIKKRGTHGPAADSPTAVSSAGEPVRSTQCRP